MPNPDYREIPGLDPQGTFSSTSNMAAYIFTGGLYGGKGKYRDAFNAFGKALSAERTYIPARFNWGVALYRSGNLKDALIKLKQLTNPPLFHVEALKIVGRCYHRFNDFERARQYYTKYVNNGGKDAKVGEWLREGPPHSQHPFATADRGQVPSATQLVVASRHRQQSRGDVDRSPLVGLRDNANGHPPPAGIAVENIRDGPGQFSSPLLFGARRRWPFGFCFLFCRFSPSGRGVNWWARCSSPGCSAPGCSGPLRRWFIAKRWILFHVQHFIN